ncbi:PREDICTED: heat shock 70 kDa protein 12A-like [Branchiostoma belcheri]|uniref:Heat shock 70 kDa protein 12A-like n=1 Tax=Branchiostoma belcheri TaxID=7741 RepID=A0A6P4Y370_BRABE|nr:PREDICTED: heat shock 70 kDa protein 12A-like [Branchiostoma belcheri]
MATPTNQTYLMVAAIDFGTTYSGYAFSFMSSPDDIIVNKNWGADVGFQSYKTPTSVLLSPEGELVAFGFEACAKYTTLLEENEDKDYYFFDRFKMRLHASYKDLDRSVYLTAKNGRTLPALDVFTHALRYLKQHMMDAIAEVSQSMQIREEDIRWVITVPAIWNDAAKQFMREAAYDANIVSKANAKKLVIALEPESASLFCRELPVNQFAGEREGDGSDTLNMAPGTRYMVVDCGGGTVDITVHEVRPDNRVKEAYAATGGAWGGTQVDEQFVALTEEVFDKSFIDDYRSSYPSEWQQWMDSFETKKRSTTSESGSVNFPIHYHFNDFHKRVKGSDVKESIDNCDVERVRFSNGFLCIQGETMRELFKDVIDDILDHVETLMRKKGLSNLAYVFLVGGFSESPLLQHAFKKRFSNHVRVLVPNDASLAVVRGAVKFGHTPHLISERISPRTYGVECVSAYNSRLHRGGKLFLGRCMDAFHKFVEAGESVVVGTARNHIFYPLYPDQTKANINVYGSYDTDTNITSAPGVEKLGITVLDMPETTGGADRQIKITFYFGDTEIEVDAVDVTTGSKANVEVNFLDDNIRL